MKGPITYVNGNFGVFSAVKRIAYSLSYISYPFLTESSTTSYARLKTDAGPIEPGAEANSKAAENVTTYDWHNAERRANKQKKKGCFG